MLRRLALLATLMAVSWQAPALAEDEVNVEAERPSEVRFGIERREGKPASEEQAKPRRWGRVTSVPVSAVYTGQRSKLRPIRDTTRTCFLAVYYRYIERL